MFNETILIGNLGSDPELRYTPQGDAVASFSVACNRRWTGRDGQPGEETVWYRVSVWGKQAESCNQYLSKGRQVFIKGRMTPDKGTGGPRIWTDNDGNPRANFELTAQTVQFLGGGNQQDGAQQARPQQTSTASAPKPDVIDADEIPF